MNPTNAFVLAWGSEVLAMLAQACATVEILRLILKPYQGIWGLGWRALSIVSALVVTVVAWTTRGNWAVAGWWELNRGYHLTFASALIACLLLVRYYSVPVPAPYKWILGAFCFYSCTDVLVNTVLQSLLYKSFDAYRPIYQFSMMLSFLVVQGIWDFALWNPLPVDARQLAPSSDSSYQRLSPEVNEELRRLNERLLQLWKLEARPN